MPGMEPMDPESVFCPNLECVARGQRGRGNITTHSEKEKRYECQVCHKTFSATTGSIFYRLRTDPVTVMQVITLLAHGCPLQAIVVAFSFDERTVKDWWRRAGEHCRAVHGHVVGESELDLGQVQADEIKVKTQAGTLWLAMAMMVSTRLWLGAVVSNRRDLNLIRALIARVRAVALYRPLLIAVDGLASYVTALQQAFRSPLPRYGQTGRAKLRAWSEVAIVQVVKQRQEGRLTIDRRIVQGTQAMVAHLVEVSQGRGGINTAYIERLNATFRQRLASLARRTRALVRQPQTLQLGVYVLGCMYNLCTYHHSLRQPFYLAKGGQRWLRRTPAIAAGLTDHCWTVEELFNHRVPPAPWTPPKRRGRRSKETLALMQRWCH
jgi:transposase-like protein